MPFKSPEARAAANRRWRQANRFAVATSARAKALRLEYGGTLSTSELRAALTLPCAYCGLPSEVVEHAQPLSRAGLNDAGNVVGACQDCNDLKGTKTVLEFFGLWPSKNLRPLPF